MNNTGRLAAGEGCYKNSMVSYFGVNSCGRAGDPCSAVGAGGAVSAVGAGGAGG